MRKSFTICLLIASLILSALCNAQEKAGYKILRKINIEGDGGWDYLTVDTSSNRLFLSHATVVQVVDIKSGKLLHTIPDTKGVHGITLAYDLNKGFISNGKDTSVTVFDLKTLDVLTKIKVTGNNPDAIIYDVFSQKVFTFNGRSSNSTVIDARTNKVMETIPLEGKPEFAVVDGKGKLFVNIEDKSKLALINTSSLKVEENWPIAPGEEPSGLAIDLKNQRLFSVCDNKLMIVLDLKTGKVIKSLPIGENVDGVAFDPISNMAFSSNGEGTVTIVKEDSPDHFTVAGNLTTKRGARTIAFDPKTKHLFLPTAEFGEAPKATPENTRPRPSIKPGSFVILELGR